MDLIFINWWIFTCRWRIYL